MNIGSYTDTQGGIQIGKRFVEQQDLWTGRDRSGEGHSLLLTARKRVGESIAQMSQPHHFEGLARPAGLAFLSIEPVLDVLADAEMGEQCPVLEDHADVAPFWGNPFGRTGHDGVADGYLSAIGGFESGDQAQKGRLATTTRAQEGQALAFLNRKVDTAKHQRVTERLAYTVDRHVTSGGAPAT